MHIDLVGADFEENLALGILAAEVERAGHSPRVVPFNRADDGEALIQRIVEDAPAVVGLSIQFQHRAQEFLELARGLRRAGYRGHITAGGHFPTLAFGEVLAEEHGIDSVVLHDGERTLPELLGVLDGGGSLAEVDGLALRGDDGAVFRTAGRRLLDDLDEVAFAKRYRAHDRHMGVPFIPMIGGRGCWGRCTYCSITSFYRDGRAHGGGSLVRLRSPESVAAEMALLWHQAGGAGIFCFHDDNFLLPRPQASLERVRAIRAELDDCGVGKAAFIGKCRPETLTPELASAIADLGVIRLYVGVENASEAGAAHLGRADQRRAVSAALEACRQAGIFVCYNLLLFEPDATLGDLRENLRFMREHADHPVNFCRAEPYHGTALHQDTAARQQLGGSYLGWNYRIEDDRTELCFRICAAAFRERNFAPQGVANRTMGLGYAAKVVEHFHGPSAETDALWRRSQQLTREITLETAAFLERAVELAETVAVDDHDAIERQTALLGLEIAAADRGLHQALDDLYGDMASFAKGTTASPAVPLRPPARLTDKLLGLRPSLALGMSLALAWTGCEDSVTVDPAPGDGGVGAGVVDPPPPDGGTGGFVADPPPPDGGVGGDAGSGGVGGAGGAGGAGGMGGMPADPPPWDSPVPAPAKVPAKAKTGAVAAPGGGGRLALVDQWRDSASVSVRTADLPLHAPPKPLLRLERDGDGYLVTLEGVGVTASTRWQAEGPVVGEGRSVHWRPLGPGDRIRVAVRSRGGVAVVSEKAL